MVQRSTFSKSFTRDLTANFGFSYPVFSRQLHPGTTWRMDMGALVRSQPQLAPTLGRIRVTLSTYFVPNRIMNSEWENFITGGLDGDSAPAQPTITVNTGSGWAAGSLADYLGFPTGVDDITVNAYKFRAYGLIYNNYIRDEQLMPAVTVSTAVGADTTTNQSLLRAAWRRDYFTKARSEPQLGAPVAIPLLGNAPVVNSGTGGIKFNAPSSGSANPTTFVTVTGSRAIQQQPASPASTGDIAFALANPSNIEADVSAVAGPSVEELRESSVIQRFKERMNNRGARYVEFLQHTFGISPQDARLQLPEYVGGGEFLIQNSEIIQTSATDASTPLATLAGHGIGKGNHRRVKYFVKEHGILMTLMIIRPDSQYSQGIPREDLYDNKFDYLLPDFANLGDQEVWKGEIFATSDGTNKQVWGYTPRYEELIDIPSTYHGEFRKDQPLNYWTVGRQFTSRPDLNASFIECDGTDRIFAVTDEDQFQVRVYGHAKFKLPLPRNRTPRLK